jgi:hypothetical protein
MDGLLSSGANSLFFPLGFQIRKLVEHPDSFIVFTRSPWRSESSKTRKIMSIALACLETVFRQAGSYNFTDINATPQKAHPGQKKA